MVKNCVACFEVNAKSPDSGCTCIPNNEEYKLYFEIYPTSLEWDQCKSNSEKEKCVQILDECLYANVNRPSKPCEKEDFAGSELSFNYNGFRFINVTDHEIMVGLGYITMDIQIHTELLQYNIGDFIGTVGGFYSLYVGFSVTGLIWQVLDFFMKD